MYVFTGGAQIDAVGKVSLSSCLLLKLMFEQEGLLCMSLHQISWMIVGPTCFRYVSNRKVLVFDSKTIESILFNQVHGLICVKRWIYEFIFE